MSDSNKLFEGESIPQIEMVSLEELKENHDDSRKFFDESKINELSSSIKELGVLNPIKYKLDGDKKIICSGNCRVKAARNAGLSHVPAIKISDKEAALIGFTENIARNDLLPMEIALSLNYLKNSLKIPQAVIAKTAGMGESTISEKLKPIELPKDMQEEALKSPLWTNQKLLALARITDEKERRDKFELIKKKIMEKEGRNDSRENNGPEINAMSADDIGSETETEEKRVKGWYLKDSVRVRKYTEELKSEVYKRFFPKRANVDSVQYKKELEKVFGNLAEILDKIRMEIAARSCSKNDGSTDQK